MKKLVLTVAAIAAAGAAFAQTNTVLSKNAVGYVKVTAPANQLVLVRNDFQELSGANFTVTNLIGNQLPSGSSVLLWDRTASTYVTENKTRSGWSPGTNVIARGAGFFLRSPSATNIYLMGEVPDATTGPTTSVANVTGLAMFGYPYPVSTTWTNINLAKNAASGDSLLLWDTPTQQYVAYNRTRSGWGSATNVVLDPGVGFWFKTAVTQQWSEVKPYTWP